MIPTAEAPDEITHLWVIRFLSEYLRLPSSQEVLAAGPLGVYGSIPQLGYLPHVLALKVLPNFSEIIAARLGSITLSLATIVIARILGQRIFPKEPLLAWSLPLVLVFHPQFVFIAVYANNDVTAVLLAAVILLGLVDTLEQGPNIWRSLIIGLFSGWLLLTKYSGYSVIACVLVFLPLAGILHRQGSKKILVQLLAVSLTAFSLSGWWFVRNYYQYHGDLTGSLTLLHTWTEAYHRRVDAQGSIFAVVTENRWWRMSFFSFWGWFGYMTRSLPRAIYYGYLAFVILGIAGGLAHLHKRWGAVQSTPATGFESSDSQQSQAVRKSIWGLLSFCLLINFFTLIYGTASGVSGPQGRYLFASEIPIIALLLAGLSKLPGRFARDSVILFVAYNIFAYLYATWFLRSLYVS
jgi:4-amino-4-deoxy-L-arabinose transferase-like glycosyltransferase